MFDYNYNSVMTHIEKMREAILDLDTRYSTTKTFLNSLEATERNIDELYTRRNTGVRTKGRWTTEIDGNCYCSSCGADMGKL